MAGLQVYSCAGLLVCGGWLHIFADFEFLRVCGFASLQLCGLAGLRVFECSKLQLVRFAGSQLVRLCGGSGGGGGALWAMWSIRRYGRQVVVFLLPTINVLRRGGNVIDARGARYMLVYLRLGLERRG